MKKLPTMPKDAGKGYKTADWKNHANNYAAKMYKPSCATATRESYFNDVKIQNICGQYAVAWNQQLPKPPKEVLFIQCFVVEFLDRPGRDLFACERFIEGDYTKHNSNAGYVDLEGHRHTPQVGR
jgi:elongation factor 2 kinase